MGNVQMMLNLEVLRMNMLFSVYQSSIVKIMVVAEIPCPVWVVHHVYVVYRVRTHIHIYTYTH